MSEDLQLTRRGLLQMVSAIVAVASFAARRPLFASAESADDPIDSGSIDDEPPLSDRARGAKLEAFLRSRSIKPVHLARESGYSREHLLRVRMGRIDPSRRCMADIVTACRRLAREPVRNSDLFDLTHADARAVNRIQRRLGDDHRKEIAPSHARTAFL